MIQSLNIGTFDKNNPDIRYKKGLEKKESGLEKKDIRYKFAPGVEDSDATKELSDNIKRTLKNMIKIARQGGMKVENITDKSTLENAILMLDEMNSEKENLPELENKLFKSDKADLIKYINKAIDKGFGGDIHYQWFFDDSNKKFIRTPTVIYWKGDNLREKVLNDEVIAFHHPKGNKFPFVPSGHLPISPIRLKEKGQL